LSERKKVAVIGGGASGLICAWLLDGHHDVVLLESSSRLGGNWHTAAHDGQVVDLGAAGVFSHYRKVRRLCGALGVSLQASGSVRMGGLNLFRANPAETFWYFLGFAWLIPLWSVYLLLRLFGQAHVLAGVTLGQVWVPRFLQARVEKWLVLSAICANFAEMREIPLLGLLAYSWANLSPALASVIYRPSGGFGAIVAQLEQRLEHADVRTEADVQEVQRTPEGAWSVRTSAEEFLVDAVFVACPTWRAREIFGAGDSELQRGLRNARKVDCKVVVHQKVPVPGSDSLLFFLSDDYVSYRLTTDEPFKSLPAGGDYPKVDDEVLLRAEFETDRFTSMPEARELDRINGQNGLWLVNSTFHPTGFRNSEQAVELALRACRGFDSALPTLGLIDDSA
jgi:uncharacterized protein